MRTVAYVALLAYLPIGVYIAVRRDNPNVWVVRFGLTLLTVSLIAALTEVI